MIDLDAPTGDLWNGAGAVPEGRSATAVATTVRHCLLRCGYETVGVVVRADAAELLEIRGLGVTCLAELHRVLTAHGRRLSGTLTWRKVAEQLASRMAGHACCLVHPKDAPGAECPSCADRAVYLLYLVKAGRSAVPVGTDDLT